MEFKHCPRCCRHKFKEEVGPVELEVRCTLCGLDYAMLPYIAEVQHSPSCTVQSSGSTNAVSKGPTP